MSESYIGQVRLFSFGSVPRDWMICDGSVLQIQQYTALYSLLDTAFGGDGKTTFCLPDLRGRVPIHRGNILFYAERGQAGGVESLALTNTQMPMHTHMAEGSLSTPPASGKTPVGNLSATIASGGAKPYAPVSTDNIVTMNAQAVSAKGGGTHNNMQPYLVLNYCICTGGYYPPRP